MRIAALVVVAAGITPFLPGLSGASRVQLLLADEDNESCLVMQDVEGNEFCLD